MINAEIARLDEAIKAQLALVPRTAPGRHAAAARSGGSHAPGCDAEGTPLLGLAERLG